MQAQYLQPRSAVDTYLVTVAGGLVSTHLQRTVPYGAPDPKIAPSS
jgi:hypothetical protein